ncbi:MAG TPA: lysoplasmalogenase [Ornithinibacter sp.]|nr:lysoplasmalogenase [Ornithinibacter sp.]
MSTVALWLSAVVTAAVMVTDWWAVARDRRDVERWAKPAAMVGLLAVAALAGAGDTASGRWLLLALVLGLVGDVMLLDDSESRFVAGLTAFLLGHLAFVASFVAAGQDRPGWGWFGLAVLSASLAVGRGILPGARARGGAALAAAVAAYMIVIGAMAVTGWATGLLLVGLGVSLFVVSDTVLALGRFVRPSPWSGPVTMLTYHGAQALIVAGLLA